MRFPLRELDVCYQGSGPSGRTSDLFYRSEVVVVMAFLVPSRCFSSRFACSHGTVIERPHIPFTHLQGMSAEYSNPPEAIVLPVLHGGAVLLDKSDIFHLSRQVHSMSLNNCQVYQTTCAEMLVTLSCQNWSYPRQISRIWFAEKPRTHEKLWRVRCMVNKRHPIPLQSLSTALPSVHGICV